LSDAFVSEVLFNAVWGSLAGIIFLQSPTIGSFPENIDEEPNFHLLFVGFVSFKYSE
jgi:hypothetical protein